MRELGFLLPNPGLHKPTASSNSTYFSVYLSPLAHRLTSLVKRDHWGESSAYFWRRLNREGLRWKRVYGQRNTVKGSVFQCVMRRHDGG